MRTRDELDLELGRRVWSAAQVAASIHADDPMQLLVLIGAAVQTTLTEQRQERFPE